MRSNLQEKTFDVESLSEEQLQSLARRLQPFLSPGPGHDDKRVVALEKEVHRLARDLYKLRLEVSEQQPIEDYDRR